MVKGREKPYLEDLGGFGGVVRLVRLIFLCVIMVKTSISWDMGFLVDELRLCSKPLLVDEQ